jgi:DNA repair protein RadC
MRLAEAAKMLQVSFFDHVILGSPSGARAPYFSFREAGVI